jgi:hypothetical protein
MKKLLIVSAMLMFSGVAIAEDVSIGVNSIGDTAWVVIDGDVYLCGAQSLNNVFCVKAKMGNSVIIE